MKKTSFTLLAFGAVAFTAASLFSSCTKSDPDSPGMEYMPDMYRSPSVETNGINTGRDSMLVNGKWVKDTIKMGNLTPPDGTIPRGFTPFPYENSDAGDSLASRFWMMPPSIARNDSNVNEGKFLFTRFCVYCHGDKGDGQGKLVASGKYTATPPNYATLMEQGKLTDGHIYWVITYGKGNMGSHASQVSPEERWKIIQYVEKLGRGGKSVAEYNAAHAPKTDSAAPKKPSGKQMHP